MYRHKLTYPKGGRAVASVPARPAAPPSVEIRGTSYVFLFTTHDLCAILALRVDRLADLSGIGANRIAASTTYQLHTKAHRTFTYHQAITIYEFAIYQPQITLFYASHNDGHSNSEVFLKKNKIKYKKKKKN